jgi:Na+-translocating ferredoxin:NAD+ oxidoreductase subunit G
MSHDTSNNSVFKITFNLFSACLVSGFIIAGVYFLTAETAAKKVIELKNESMRSLVPSADDFKNIDGKKEWVKALSKGQTLAVIVPAESKGYGGSIKMLVAVSPDNKVLNYTIISANETPGLGDKAGKEPFMHDVIGKDVPRLQVTKDPANKENVHAIAGATITSRAVTKGIREAVELVTASGVK